MEGWDQPPPQPSLAPGGRGGRHHRICIATLPDSRFQRTVVRTRRRYASVRPPSPLSLGDHTYKKVVYAYTNYGLRKSGVTPHKTDNFGFNLIGIGCLVRAFRIWWSGKACQKFELWLFEKLSHSRGFKLNWDDVARCSLVASPRLQFQCSGPPGWHKQGCKSPDGGKK